MSDIYKTPQWVTDLQFKQFQSSSYMTDDARTWIRQSRNWLKKFLKERFGFTSFTKENFTFSVGHYEWSCYVKINDQWWTIFPGDCRFKIGPWLTVRKSDADYHKGNYPNINIPLNAERFVWDLEQILKLGSQ